MAMSEKPEPEIVDVTAIVESHPLLDEEDLHGGVAERLKHSKEFGALVWDATKDYVQKMNLTSEEKANLSTWLSAKKDHLQKTIVEKLNNLHQNDE
jgi:hypothetical protein